MFGVSMDTGGLIEKLNGFVSPSSVIISGDLCHKHGVAYLQALQEATGWAVKMWDSSAKAQTALMTGNLNSLGNFDECISVQNVFNHDSYFSGQHCLATLKLENISASDAMGKTFQKIMDEEEEINMGLGYLLSKGLRWAFCIPSTCTSKDLEAELTEFIGNTSGVKVSVSSTDCHFDHHESFNPADWIAIVIFTALTLTVILSTLYESLKAHIYSSVDSEIPPPMTSAISEYLRSRLDYILSYRRSDFLRESLNSSANRRIGSIEIVPCTSDQPQTSAPRHEQKYSSMTGHLTVKGKNFWSRSDSVTPTSSEVQSGHETPVGKETQTESRRPQSLELPGHVQAVLNPTSQDSSQAPLEESQHPTAAELERYQTLAGRIQDVLGNGANGVLGTNEDVTPTTEHMEDNFDPWTAFSVISNGKKIFRFENSLAKLQSLHGIKFLSVCWVLIGYTCLITESLPAMNYVAIKDYTKRWFAVPLLNASLAADTFIVVTGVLSSYNFLRDMRRRGVYRRDSNRLSRTGLKGKFFTRYLPVYYLHRQFRLTPSLAAIILLQVSLLGYLGSGPFWKSGNFQLSEACREGWKGTLSYTQNFINTDNMCPKHSWYLMVDMQLYIISPLILLMLLAWSKKRSLTAVGVLISMGVTVSFIVNYLLELPAGFMTGDPSKWQLKTEYEFMATYTRFAPWLVGIGVGYLLYCSRRGGRIELSMQPVAVYLGWILSMLALVYAVVGVFPFQQSDKDAFRSSLYSSLRHTMWALAVGWVILACESDHGGVIYTVLSWKIFQPLSRLTFCIYLVHLPLITARTLMTRVPIYFDGMTALSSVLGDLLFSILLATILSLFVEIPFIRLYKYATIKLGMPVRQRLHQKGLSTEYHPLLGDSVFTSYQSVTPQPSDTRQQPGSSNVVVIHEGNTAETASVAQQTDSDQSRPLKSTLPSGITSGESHAPSTVSEGNRDTSDSLSSSNPVSNA